MGSILKPYSPKKRYVPKNLKHEETLQKQVCSYLRLQYPTVIFRTDFTAGRIVLSQYQAVQYASMQSGRGFPDIFIYEPRYINGVQYAGLGLELKNLGTTIILKIGPNKGHLTADKHIREQVLMCRELKKRGYYATIACGLDEAIKVIDWYFGKSKVETAQLF